MLLNEFSYHLSVLKNEQHQNRLKLKSLLPQRSIYDGVENPFEKEEYNEEIKKIVVKGGSGDQVEGVELDGGDDGDDGELDSGDDGELDSGDEVELDGGDDVELDGGDDVELDSGDEVELDDGDEVELDGGDVELDGGDVELDGLEGGEEIGGVVFDNLSNKGGTSTMENVKNVVVSFF
jgi:hypothetical protein